MKKLTLQQAEAFFLPRKMTWREKNMIDYYADLKSNSIILTRKVKWPLFVALYIPALISEFFALIWDGGLSEFVFPTREMSCYGEYFDWDEKKGNIVKELLDS